MPAPCTIVTLVDEDGDEFPVRLPGTGYTIASATQTALAEAKKLVQAGTWRPTGILILRNLDER